MINAAVLLQAVLDSRDGITISDPSLPDNPLIFANNAFLKMTGYSREEIFNRNCRFLQGNSKNQRHIEVIRDSIKNAKSCLVTLKNYRKNGTMFWNELSISPVFDEEGKVTHFIGIQKDISARVQLEQHLRKELKSSQESNANLEELVIQDSLTGIFNRRHFDYQLKENWPHLEDRQASLTLMMLDIDNFKSYNDLYGHIAGDEALKQVATTLATAMKRDTDFTARYGGEEFVIFATDMPEHQALNYAKTLCDKIQNLNILHEGSSEGVLTISCGIAYIESASLGSPDVLLQQADAALYESKSQGRNQVIMFAST